MFGVIEIQGGMRVGNIPTGKGFLRIDLAPAEDATAKANLIAATSGGQP